jgi:AraC-like DNA-binding protein
MHQSAGLQTMRALAVERARGIAALGLGNSVRLESPDRDITITCVDGQPVKNAEFSGEGPATFCIAVFLDGSGSLAIDGGAPLAVEPGTAIVFSSRRSVRGTNMIKADRRVRFVDIRFELGMLAQLGGQPLARMGGGVLVDCSVPESGAFLVGFAAPSALLDAARQILECPFDRAETRNLYLRAKALESLALTIDAVDSAARATGIVGGRIAPKVLKARRLIEHQFEESWTIERLARTVGLNERDLKAGFRRLVGSSIHAHLRSVRLEAAASMLREGRTVTDAALAAGFGNLSHFSKTFRESKGVAPREYARLPRFTQAGAVPGGPIDR